MQPENGGLGVFAHEYGHDLGLPDQYDTAGAATNSTVGFWTLMSSGSWLGTGKAIGDLPGDMNAWDKLQLGWLNYDTAKAGDEVHRTSSASPSTTPRTRRRSSSTCPKKTVTTDGRRPAAGRQAVVERQR